MKVKTQLEAQRIPEQAPEDRFLLHGQIEQSSIQRVIVSLEGSFTHLMRTRTHTHAHTDTHTQILCNMPTVLNLKELLHIGIRKNE